MFHTQTPASLDRILTLSRSLKLRDVKETRGVEVDYYSALKSEKRPECARVCVRAWVCDAWCTRECGYTNTNLFHDAGFPLGERGVPPELIVDVFHLNFHPALGLLSVRGGRLLRLTQTREGLLEIVGHTVAGHAGGGHAALCLRERLLPRGRIITVVAVANVRRGALDAPLHGADAWRRGARGWHHGGATAAHLRSELGGGRSAVDLRTSIAPDHPHVVAETRVPTVSSAARVVHHGAGTHIYSLPHGGGVSSPQNRVRNSAQSLPRDRPSRGTRDNDAHRTSAPRELNARAEYRNLTYVPNRGDGRASACCCAARSARPHSAAPTPRKTSPS